MCTRSWNEMDETGPKLTEFVEKSTTGILNLYEEDSKRQAARLNEFLTKQNQLLTAVDKEFGKFNSIDNLQLEDMISIMKTCQARLQNIKERMRKASMKTSKLKARLKKIKERMRKASKKAASKLKARSLKIQQLKQKQALDRELRREAQLTREQEMVGKSPSFQNYCPESTSKALPPKPSSVHSL